MTQALFYFNSTSDHLMPFINPATSSVGQTARWFEQALLLHQMQGKKNTKQPPLLMVAGLKILTGP